MADIIIVIERKRARSSWIALAPRTGNCEQQYRVFYEGREIGSWACPEHDAARWLIANGKAQRTDTLRARRLIDGEEIPSMRGGVGWFADRTVIEDDNGPPRYGKYVPFPATRFLSGAPSRGSDGGSGLEG